MNIKPIKEFDYEENKEKIGFFFLGNSKSSETAIKGLCDKLIVSKVASDYPSAIYQQANLTIFVYDGVGFSLPDFFAGAKMAEEVGICKVGNLTELNIDIMKE